MIADFLAALAQFIIHTIDQLGYSGVVVLMGIESACIPLPSEVIMPFAGSLVPQRFSLWMLGLAGAIGCVLGSIVAYGVGKAGGRPLIERYGKYLLVSPHDVDLADLWFERYGEAVVFFSRLLPVIRTFIAFPAGVARMNMPRFILYTFVGSYPWCYGLAYAGHKLGEHWDTLGVYFHRFDFAIGAGLVGAAAWWIRRHLRLNSSLTEEAKAAASGPRE